MRFFAFSGATVAGLRLGISFGPEDFGSRRHTSAIEGGFVYVMVRANGDVKVGETRNPPQRLRSLQTGSAQRLAFAFVAAIATPGEVEAEAQSILERFRMRGEWFETEPEAAIAAVCAAAARLGRRLHIVDPVAASRAIPSVLRDVAQRRTRRRGLRNVAIVAAALLTSAVSVSQAIAFIDAHQDPIVSASAAALSDVQTRR